MKNQMIYDVSDKPPVKKWIFLSLQHVFAMFGATVLVPTLTGLPVAVALVASGLGTISYIICTKGKVPVYLGSSFAYIAYIAYTYKEVSAQAMYSGLVAVGVLYVLIALLIGVVGKEWINKLLPPLIIGPMIAIIGLSLAPVAINQAINFEGNFNSVHAIVAVITFLSTVFIALLGKGFFKVVPFLGGIMIGYVTALAVGLVDLDPIMNAPLFAIPQFYFVAKEGFNFSEVFVVLPLAFVTMAEHIGDHTVLGQVTNRNYLQDPGLNRTLLGDGIGTIVSAMIGGPANTTYGENTGVVAMTKVGSVYVTGLAAIFAICLGFSGTITAFIQSIPQAVMGGISVVLFGLIASNGLKVLVSAHVDMNSTRNILIIAAMLVVGLGGAEIPINNVAKLSSMALAVLVGVTLNFILPKDDKK